MKKNNYQKNHKFNIGTRIVADKVLCIDNNNTNHGIISISSALKLAQDCGLDLVQVSDSSSERNVPTCKILDFGKLKYDQIKKEKEAKRKQRQNTVKIKEIKFRPATNENDLKIKAKQAQEFINLGHKVKISILFKGRELSHQSIASEKFNIFLSMIQDVGVEEPPTLFGKQMTAVLFKQIQEKERATAE